MALNLDTNQRAQRKTLVTVAEWGTGSTPNRQVLGARTEDSSIEFNPEVTTSTDILGITYTDVEKTEPQQSFDPMYILGGTALHEYLVNAALENDINKFNGVFTLYIITGFIGTGSGTSASYKCVKHTGCSIIPQSLGGDAYVNLPVEVHFSNNITKGTVDQLSDDFTFTATT